MKILVQHCHHVARSCLNSNLKLEARPPTGPSPRARDVKYAYTCARTLFDARLRYSTESPRPHRDGHHLLVGESDGTRARSRTTSAYIKQAQDDAGRLPWRPALRSISSSFLTLCHALVFLHLSSSIARSTTSVCHYPEHSYQIDWQRTCMIRWRG
ncbi:hypothetical protein OH77DRAFT_1081197 [Trametes cingulata]|nr:hypothetical protein OH77DRAFT_1081197 [Trametes cingulata]